MKRLLTIISLSLIFWTWLIQGQNLQAQPFPGHPITLVIPGAPGDAADIGARAVAEELTKILKTPIITLNKPGAAAAVGTDFVAKSKKDGYTLLYGISAGTIYSPALNPDTIPYDPIRDLEPLGFHAFFPCILSVRSDSPWNSFKEVIQYARENPGKFRVSTLGVGSINHFQIEIIKSVTGVDITMVPFKGASPAVTGLLGGHVESTFVALAVSGLHHASGKLRGLLVDRKVADMPDVPILRDLGYARDLPSPNVGIFGPAGMSEEAKKVLIPAIEQAIKTPEVVSKMDKMRLLTDYRPPAEHRKIWVEDYENARILAKKIAEAK